MLLWYASPVPSSEIPGLEETGGSQEKTRKKQIGPAGLNLSSFSPRSFLSFKAHLIPPPPGSLPDCSRHHRPLLRTVTEHTAYVKQSRIWSYNWPSIHWYLSLVCV